VELRLFCLAFGNWDVSHVIILIVVFEIGIFSSCEEEKEEKQVQVGSLIQFETLMFLFSLLCFMNMSSVSSVERRRTLFSRQTLHPSLSMSFSLQVIFPRVKSNNTWMSKYKSLPIALL
jgi:hypothetical protein